MTKATTRKADASGSESESEHLKSATKGAASANHKGRDASEEQEENEENGGSDNDDDGDEEEYEIEAILDAKHGSFPNGRTGYLVKWKNYSEEHNSWVNEKDAQGAKELIHEFWKTNGKKGSVARKSDPKPKPTSKPRKSTTRAATEDSDIEELAHPAKKRGRPSKASARSPSEEQEQMEEDAPKKKPRRTSAAAKSASARRAAPPLEDSDQEQGERVYQDMKKWKDVSSWEHLVECIDTVERTEDNELLVYFTLKFGKGYGKEKADVCKQKIPNLLIDFYQSNLRWKPSDENAMEE